jgi:hypothetical protein
MKYLQYRMIASHMFKWTNLPAGIESEELELMLIRNNSVGFFNTTKGQYILPYRDFGERNIYNKPVRIFPVTFNGESLPLIRDGSFAAPPLILWDNSVHESFNRYLAHYSSRLAEIQKSIIILEEKLRIPTILSVNDENEESVTAIVSRIREGNPVITVEETANLPNAIKVFDMFPRPELLRILWEDYNKIEGEVYALLGTMFNVEQNKAAGVGQAETVVNYSQTFAIANSRLQQRQDWCDKVNALYNIGIWCEKAHDIEDIIAETMNSQKVSPAGMAEGAATAAKEGEAENAG